MAPVRPPVTWRGAPRLADWPGRARRGRVENRSPVCGRYGPCPARPLRVHGPGTRFHARYEPPLAPVSPGSDRSDLACGCAVREPGRRVAARDRWPPPRERPRRPAGGRLLARVHQRGGPAGPRADLVRPLVGPARRPRVLGRPSVGPSRSPPPRTSACWSQAALYECDVPETNGVQEEEIDLTAKTPRSSGPPCAAAWAGRVPIFPGAAAALSSSGLKPALSVGVVAWPLLWCGDLTAGQMYFGVGSGDGFEEVVRAGRTQPRTDRAVPVPRTV